MLWIVDTITAKDGRIQGSGKVEVIAHRGSSSVEAEHTLRAYERAIEEGADALECDVRLTADGVLVCLHDRRIDRTSDGRGVVSTKSLAELERHDFAAWHLDSDYGGVLTLERLLGLVTDADRHVRLAIETKHPSRYGRLVEEKLVEMLARFGLARPPRYGESQVRVMSFSEVALRRMRDLAPSIPTVFLMDRVPLRCRNGWLPFGASIAGPSVEVIRAHPHYPERVHRAGGKVFVWTVDSSADVQLCLDTGVDAIITNRPRQVLGQLGR